MPLASERYHIADRLADARRRAQPAISQKALAEKVAQTGLIGCTGSRISRIEAGYADATLVEIGALAAVLGTSAEWLADGATAAVPAVPPNNASRPPAAPPESSSPDTEPIGLERLERAAHPNDYAYRQFLNQALAKARAQLAVPGIPAAEWRQWRAVERRAGEAIRGTL